MRLVVLILLLLLVSGFYYVNNQAGGASLLSGRAFQLLYPGRENIATQPDVPLHANPALISVLNVPPGEMRYALQAAYRLKPDRRFLLAVAEVHHFLSGKPKTEAIATFQVGRWIISYNGEDVGALPERPDFSDALALLSTWAHTVAQKYPLCLSKSDSNQTTLTQHSDNPSRRPTCDNRFHSETRQITAQELTSLSEQLDGFLTPDLAAATRRINTLWGNGVRDPALLQLGTRALAFLTAQLLDRIETADLVPAKAFALLVLTKTFTNIAVTHEEALIAEFMSYSAHAERVARALPPENGVRLYISRNDQALMQLALQRGGTVEARYLALLRLAQLRDVEVFASGLRNLFPADWLSLPIIKTGLDLNRFGINPTLSEALPQLVLLNLAQEVGMPNLMEILRKAKQKPLTDQEVRALLSTLETILRAESSTLIDRFESGLPILDRLYQGPFLDSPTFQAYYRAYFFSSFYIIGLHYLDSLSSGVAAQRFADTLGNSSSGTAAQFQRWYRNLAQSKSGKGDLSHLMQDLSQLQNFGAPPLIRTFDEQQEYFAYGDPALLNAAKLLVSRMDTRMSDRVMLVDVAYSKLVDLRLAEQLLRSVVEADPWHHQYQQVWLAGWNEDQSQLQNLLHASHVELQSRLTALKELDRLNALRPEAIRTEYRQLIDADPRDWRARKQYIAFLERHKDYQTARNVATDWLALKVFTAGLEPVFAQTSIARMFYLEGRYQEGLDAITPVVKSYQAHAMETAALLLDKVGKAEDAEKMARLALDRYPGSLRTRAVLLEILWRHNRFSDAAAAIKASLHPINLADWKLVIGKSFNEVFSGRPIEDSLRAFGVLLEKGFSQWELLHLAYEVNQAGNSELAFRMGRQLRSSGIADLDLLVGTYGFLKDWEGQVKAVEWLKTMIPTSLRNPTSMIAFDRGAFELLWELILQPDAGDHPDFVWLMRAAAAAKQGLANHPHINELIQYYTAHTQTPYDIIGRYLIGLATEEQVLTLATDAKKRCEIAYYMGLRAQGEGRYEDASDWYRVSVETGLINNGEYRWAHTTLYKWYVKGKPLGQLAQARM